jgi:hypothetical protein
MELGAAIFFTDYSIGPAALGRAMEERRFGSWAPEHLPPAKADEVLPVPDRCAALMR